MLGYVRLGKCLTGSEAPNDQNKRWNNTEQLKRNRMASTEQDLHAKKVNPNPKKNSRLGGLEPSTQGVSARSSSHCSTRLPCRVPFLRPSLRTRMAKVAVLPPCDLLWDCVSFSPCEFMWVYVSFSPCEFMWVYVSLCEFMWGFRFVRLCELFAVWVYEKKL